MIIERLLFAIASLLAVSILIFAATQALPGNAAVARLGKNATPTAVASFEKLFHLNQPVTTQYFHWLGHLLQGQLGISFATGSSVGSLIGHDVSNSLVLMVAVAVIGMPLAIALGIFTAVRHDRVSDHVTSVLLLVISALPEFVVAIALIVFLATDVFALLPAVSPINPQQSIFDQLNLLILPALTLILVVLPYVGRTVRACMIEALDSEFVTMARLKGMPERRVILRHALPNIAGPTFQVIAQSLAYLAGGIIVVETVFQYPGVGQAFIQAVDARDIPVIQALALLLAAFYVVVNIVADVGTTAMTPTMRREAR